jgi:tryptophan 2,3-dioxygenase
MPESSGLTYGAYLQLERLLGAQRPPDPAAGAPAGKSRDLLHHDEMLFIVVHQVYELWFKQMLHELSYARDLLGRAATGGAGRADKVAERDIPTVCATLERVNEIFRIATAQWRVLETMNPAHFLTFRDAISPASGFQSVQFREMEALAGLDQRRDGQSWGNVALQLTQPERAAIEARAKAMSLKDALMDWLRRTPIEQAYPKFAEDYAAAFDRYVADQVALQAANPHATAAERAAAGTRLEALKAAIRTYFFGPAPGDVKAHQAFMFIATYREEPLLRWPSVLLDRLVEFEQSFREFRFRHARMVERMIGTRTGTGGSPGLAYLEQTASYRIFGNLLEARNFLIARRYLPEVPNPGVLRFRFGE